MDQYPLTEEKIAFYRANGFVQLDNVLTPDELEQLRQAVDQVLYVRLGADIELSQRNPEYEKVFVQKLNLWRVNEQIRQFVLHPRIAEIARRLAGVSAMRLWHDHLLAKMPGDSKASPWHQDFPYWPMNESGALSCWMALDDVNEQNGCMQFIPGSQALGALEPINLVTPQDLFGIAAEHGAQLSDPVIVPLKAGSCTFHNGLTFHYAGPNRTENPRRAMVTIFFADGVTFNGRRHPVTNDLGLEAGAPLAADVLPIVAQE